MSKSLVVITGASAGIGAAIARAFSAAGAPVISLGHQPNAEAGKLRAFMLNPPKSAPDPSSMPAILTQIHTPADKLALVEPATLAQAADFIAALVMKLDAELPG